MKIKFNFLLLLIVFQVGFVFAGSKGDGLGNHKARKNLNMDGFNFENAPQINKYSTSTVTTDTSQDILGNKTFQSSPTVLSEIEVSTVNVKSLGTSQNSAPINFSADNSGNKIQSKLQFMYGADPYFRISVDDDSASPLLFPVIDFHDTILSFPTDAKVDIGGTSDNRPHDINVANQINSYYLNILGTSTFNGNINACLWSISIGTITHCNGEPLVVSTGIKFISQTGENIPNLLDFRTVNTNSADYVLIGTNFYLTGQGGLSCNNLILTNNSIQGSVAGTLNIGDNSGLNRINLLTNALNRFSVLSNGSLLFNTGVHISTFTASGFYLSSSTALYTAPTETVPSSGFTTGALIYNRNNNHLYVATENVTTDGSFAKVLLNTDSTNSSSSLDSNTTDYFSFSIGGDVFQASNTIVSISALKTRIPWLGGCKITGIKASVSYPATTSTWYNIVKSTFGVEEGTYVSTIYTTLLTDNGNYGVEISSDDLTYNSNTWGALDISLSNGDLIAVQVTKNGTTNQAEAEIWLRYWRTRD